MINIKKIFIIISLFLLAIIPIKINAISTIEANENIDINRNSSLELKYKYEDLVFDDIEIKLYKIANVDEEFQYKLVNDFNKYPLIINGIKENDDWNNLSETLKSYIIADNISEDYINNISNNEVLFDNLETGLYLVETPKIETEDYILFFDTFLVSIPSLNEEGTWNYEVTAYPKAESYTPKYKDITYTVIKEWKDNRINRPKSVDIDIYKDGEFIESQTLDSNKNWMYSWLTKDDGSIWTVVERNISEGYKVTIDKNLDKFIIVNTKIEENPQTEDNIYLFLVLLVSSFCGFIIMIFNIRRKAN